MPHLRDLFNVLHLPSGKGGDISAKQLRQLLSVQLLFAAAHSLGWVLFVPWAFRMGITELDYIMYSLVLWALTIPLLLIKRKPKANRAMALGLFGRAIAFFIAISLFSTHQMFIIAALVSWVIVEFWVSFNTVYERKAPKKDRAFLNSVMMVIHPLAGAVLPVVAGLVAIHLGFEYALFAGGVVMLIAGVAALRIKGLGRVELDPVNAFKHMRRAEPFILIQGFWEGIEFTAVPLVTLSLVATMFDYAWFFAYLGLVGAIAAIIFGRLSDALHARARFASFLAAMMGLFAIAAGLSWDYISWAVFVGLMSFCGYMVKPFLWTIVADVSGRRVVDGMLVREYFLNTGRTLGVVMLLVFFLFFSLKASMLVAGVAMMLYPLVLLYEKRHRLKGIF